MSVNHRASSYQRVSSSPRRHSDTRTASSFVTHSSDTSDQDEGLYSEGSEVHSSGSSLSRSLSSYSSDPNNSLIEAAGPVAAPPPQLSTFKKGYRMGQKAEQASTHREAKWIASQVAAVAMAEHEETYDGFRAALQSKLAETNDEAYAAYLQQLLQVAAGQLRAAKPAGPVRRRSSNLRHFSDRSANGIDADQRAFGSSVTINRETSDLDHAVLPIGLEDHYEHRLHSKVWRRHCDAPSQQHPEQQLQQWLPGPLRPAHAQGMTQSRPSQQPPRSQRWQQHGWQDSDDDQPRQHQYQQQQEQQQQHKQQHHHQQQQEQQHRQQHQQRQQLRHRPFERNILPARIVSTTSSRPPYQVESGHLAGVTYRPHNRTISFVHPLPHRAGSQALEATRAEKEPGKTNKTAKSQKRAQRTARKNQREQHDAAASPQQRLPELATGQKLNMSLDTICKKKMSVPPNTGSAAKSLKRKANGRHTEQGCSQDAHDSRGSAHQPHSKKFKPGGNVQRGQHPPIPTGWNKREGGNGTHGIQAHKRGTTHRSIASSPAGTSVATTVLSSSVPAGLNSALGTVKKGNSTPGRLNLINRDAGNSSKSAPPAMSVPSGKHRLIVFRKPVE